MANKSGDLGRQAENAVVQYLAENGWPNAERRRLRGRYDPGDITGIPGLCIEVKGGHAAERASDGLIEEWLGETEIERANIGAERGILVVKRKGIGYARAGEWWSITPGLDFASLVYPDGDDYRDVTGTHAPIRTHLAHMVTLLRDAGYGDPL